MEQYRSIVGPLAEGGKGDAGTFVFKLMNDATAKSLKPDGLRVAGTFQEWTSQEIIVPDAGGIVGPRTH